MGDVDIRYAGIGGLSEAIGWTEVQQEQNKVGGKSERTSGSGCGLV